MADVTISSLPLGTPSGGSIIPIVNSNVTQRTTIASLTGNLITPSYIGVAKAWANFNGLSQPIGQNQTIRASHNINNILRLTENNYEVFFTPGTFNNANYLFLGMASTSINRASIISGPILTAPSTASFRFANFSLVYTGQPAGWINEGGEYICIAFFSN